MYIDLHIDGNKEHHTRGKVVETDRGRKILYPKICDKFEPRKDAAHPTMHVVIDGRMKKRHRQLKKFPERDELYEKGLNDDEIAERLGVCKGAIVYWRKMRGLSANIEKPENYSDNDERDKLYKQGLSDRAIAEKLGVNRRTITSWRVRKGYRPNSPEHPGGNMKRDMPERDGLYMLGLNDHEIARRLGVSPAAIYSWRQNRGLPANTSPGRRPKRNDSQ